jgi:integrase
MAVFKKNGNLWVDCYLKGKRLRRKVGPDKRTAQLVEKDLKVKAAKGEWLGIQERKKRITFEAFFLKYFVPRQLKSDGTAKGYLSAFAKHYKPAFGSKYLDAIQGEQIEEFMAGRLSEAKPSTVNKERAYLQSIFGAAVRWQYIAKNPLDQVSRVKVPERKYNVLSPDDVSKLLDATSGWLRVFLGLALNTGMRREEMRTMEWVNIDFNRAQITIATDGTFTTKNRRNRTIPVNTFLIELLSKHPRHITSPYVFTSVKADGQPMDADSFNHRFNRALTDLSLPHYRIHDLRHTFGTRRAEKGVDPRTIMELMGHTTIEMTVRYIHTSTKRKASAVQNLGLDGRSEADDPARKTA